MGNGRGPANKNTQAGGEESSEIHWEKEEGKEQQQLFREQQLVLQHWGRGDPGTGGGVHGGDTDSCSGYAGALALEAMNSMKRSLLTTSGEEVEEGVKPVALLYYRSVLGRRSSGAQSRGSSIWPQP